MGFGKKNIESGVNTEKAVAAAQIGSMEKSDKRADENYALFKDLIQPAVELNKSFATGDRKAMLPFLSPVVGQIDSGYTSARDSIINSTDAGPARDFALAKLERDRYAQKAGASNELYTSSFDKLANIGSGLGSFSLQQLGASLRAGEGASITGQSVANAGLQQKASTMGMFGQLAQAAGSTVAAKPWK